LKPSSATWPFLNRFLLHQVMADQPGYPIARHLGRIVQAIGLALAVIAVLIQLLRTSTELTFRYGGF
jgi:hypothetical protein